jgi:hypothetical protein
MSLVRNFVFDPHSICELHATRTVAPGRQRDAGTGAVRE